MAEIQRRESALLQLIVKHNPFYLLSAACMLAGCLALTNSVSWNPIGIRRLLTLIITLNVYEAALIWLALFLVTRRDLVRDGRILLILEAFFLVDTAFLNAEIVTLNFRIGLIVNMALFALAMLKLWIVIAKLYPNFPIEKLLFVFIELAALFTIPCLLRHMDRGTVSPASLYVTWWMAALLPALYDLLTMRTAQPPGDGPSLHHPKAAPVQAYVALPYLSLLMHIGILHYVYNVTFFGADAAPILLGLTLIMNRVTPTRLIPRADLVAFRVLLPAAAVLVSLNNPHLLHLQFPGMSFLNTSALRLACAGTYLTYLHCFFPLGVLLKSAVGCAGAAAILVGPGPSIFLKMLSRIWDWLLRVLENVIPRTLTQWGVAGVAASFVFLVLGAWVSLRKPTPLLSRPETDL